VATSRVGLGTLKSNVRVAVGAHGSDSVRGGEQRVDIVSTSVYTYQMSEEMREPTFLVLAALAGGRRHGYGIIQEVERLSDGGTHLRAGTLYAMLDRLTHDGLIVLAGEEVVEGRLRRYYELATKGSLLLAAESRRRVVVSKEALRRLRIAGTLA
jgi:PadR family transcriptional regulator, regulatory protein PadR